jgi:hypothetical protein
MPNLTVLPFTESQLIDAFDELGLDTFDDVRRYSGLGMNGDSCLGIILAESQVLSVGAALAMLTTQSEQVQEWGDPGDLLRRLMRAARTDNMGRYSVVVYFPGFTLAHYTESE